MRDSSTRSQRTPARSPFPVKAFWITLAISAVIYAPSLAWSLGLDQNIFGTIGWLLLKGKTLYVDAWDVKPPNVFYTYALFESLFGNTDLAVRLSDFVATLLAAAAMFAAVNRRVRREPSFVRTWAPVVCTLLLVLTLFSLGLSDTAQTESFALCWILIAPLLALEDKDSWRWLSGAAIGVATFYKTTNAIFLLPIVAELVFIPRTRSLRSVVYLFTGFAVWSVLQLAILGLQGSLTAYLKITRDVLVFHPGEASTLHAFDLLRALWVSVDVWLVIALAAIVCAILRSDAIVRRVIRLPFLYLLCGLLVVYLQNKGWGYHYVVTHPGLISLCGISFVYVVNAVREHYGARTALLITSAVVILSITVTPSARRRLHQLESAQLAVQNRESYIGSLGAAHTLYHPASSEELVRYVAERTLPHDTIWILGEEPGVYWRTGRTPANKFVYTLLSTSGVIAEDTLQSVISAVVHSRPKLVVISMNDTTNFRGRSETSMDLLERDATYAPLKQVLIEAYERPDTVANSFLAYRRRL